MSVGGLEVLRLVDDDVGAVQRPAPQVGDRLERELLAARSSRRAGRGRRRGCGVSVRATSASFTAVIHGSSFSSRLPGRNPSSALPTGHDRPVDGELVVAAASPSPARGRRRGPGSSCRCRPCRRGRPRAPRGRAAGRARTAAPSTAGRRPHASRGRSSGTSWPSRWRTSADWLPARSTANSLISSRATASASQPVELGDVDARRARENRRSMSSALHVGRASSRSAGGRRRAAPRRWCSMASRPTWAALMRSAASLDTTTARTVDRCPSAAARMRLSAFVGSSPCSRPRRACRPLVSMRSGAAAGQRHGVADVAAVGDAQLLDGPDDLPGGPTDVVHPRLVLVELLDDDERDHRVGVGEGEQRVGIGDEHRRVEHDPGSASGRSDGRIEFGHVRGRVDGRDGKGARVSVTGLPRGGHRDNRGHLERCPDSVGGPRVGRQVLRDVACGGDDRRDP